MSTGRGLPGALAERVRPALTRAQVALGGAVLLVAAVRSLPVLRVFRPGGVVLSSNDPHFYRYHVEQLTADSWSVLDVGVLVGMPTADGEPLTVAVLWFVSELFGGAPATVGTVLAWYPVVTAVLAALLVYWTALVLTADRRVGLAAVLVFAVVPGHAFRTGLGFADHHAMDYLFLALTMAALVEIAARPAQGRRRLVLAGALALGVSGQVLAWEAGGLLLVPTAVGMVAVAAVATRWSEPLQGMVPAIAGTTLAASLVGGAHLLLGWHETVAVAVPALLAIGTAALAAVSIDAVRRRSSPATAVLLASIGAMLLIAGATVLVVRWESLTTTSEQIWTDLVGPGGVAEATSLGAGFGPVVGPLVMLGFAPLLALPGLAVGLRRASSAEAAAWSVVGAYVVWFLGLSLLQRRFVGELAVPLSVVAGVGFVALLAWFDLVEGSVGQPDREAAAVPGQDDGDISVPGRRRAVIVGAFGVTLGGFPSLYTAAIHDRVNVTDPAYEAARFMRAYADERGWEYPGRYVFSDWGRNRMYNQVVSGEGRSYSFAQSNFSAFLSSRDPGAWYRSLQDRAGFVVTTDDPPARTGTLGSVYETLHRDHGGDSGNTGAGHYRAICVTGGGRVTAFALVPGARIVGQAEGGRVTATARVAIEGATIDYERTVATDETGSFDLRVAQPGEYEVAGQRVTVPERAVEQGEVVELPGADG